MQIVDAVHHALVDGHDQITLAQPCLTGRAISFDRHDLDGPLVGQIVEQDQAAMEQTLASGDPQIARRTGRELVIGTRPNAPCWRGWQNQCLGPRR
jgi:hypothetical protein